MTSNNNLTTISSMGVQALCDFALYIKGSNIGNLVLMSLYGSLIQLQALHATLVSNYTVTTSDSITLCSIAMDSTKLKCTKIGYGKYHGLIYAQDTIQDSVILLENDDLIDRTAEFLSKRTIPFKKDWIPKILELGIDEGYITKLESIGNISGYFFSASDKEICDLIVERIFY